jgi:hypothetical protein
MSKLEKIDIHLTGIGHALSETRLTVPPYQRSYAWEDKNVTDLLDDLEKAINDREQEYFLGSIVVTGSESGPVEVVDGQQRLATIMILISAIRDYFYNNENKEDAETIERDFIFSIARRTHERVPHLQLNQNDNDYFQKRVLSYPNDPSRRVKPAKNSHKLMLQAFENVEKRIKKIIADTRKPAEKLHDWLDYIEKFVKVIWVSVPDYANAFIIFETLNDRGLDLAISDLLKNYLFGLSQERIGEVQQRWQSMFGALEAVDSEDMVVTYIRQLWSSKHGLTRNKDLFESIKENTPSKAAALDLSNELMNGSKIYAAILNPSHEFWATYGTTTRQHMETLNLLKMIQIRPLLISVLSKFSSTEIKKSMHLMVSLAVRFLIFGGLGGGKLEQEYCDRAVEIEKGKITTTHQLITAMKDVVPTDSQFKTAFETANVSKAYLARYYLRALEKVAKGQDHPELVPNPNEEQLNLEHILPQGIEEIIRKNPKSAWSRIDPDDARAYCDRLGNMALLVTKDNSTLGDADFSMKAPVYKSIDLMLTSALADSTDWGIEQIRERQIKLSELAVKAWPYKA